MKIGGDIKQLRVKMNLTQEELAHRCELSKGFISQLERDIASPSIATLVDILESLGTNLCDFFAEAADDKLVFTKEDFSVTENPERGTIIGWIIPNAQKNAMEPILLTLNPGGQTEEQKPYQGEVFGYVLKGAVTLIVGTRKQRVRAGDSFYYKANAAHSLQNTGKTPAEVLWVCTPPNF